jgi:hypothetical protein
VHECGVPVWQRDAHPSADDCPLSWLQVNIGSREQVAAGVAWMGALRQRQVRIQLPDQDFHGARLGAGAGHMTIPSRSQAWPPAAAQAFA